MLGRISEVMKDKYSLSHKFLVIASLLNDATASDDADAFDELKKIRDTFFHGSEISVSDFPTERIQRLVLKYMKLHLERA